MSTSKVFSGPPSNKATAATIATAVATLFWTIAAHTFWKNMNTADMTLYITTSTVFLTAIISFRVPESAAYTAHSKQRLDDQAAAQVSKPTVQALEAAIQDLDAKVQWSQQLDKAMADRLGIALPPVISADGVPAMLTQR
jgi:hypothetical protein